MATEISLRVLEAMTPLSSIALSTIAERSAVLVREHSDIVCSCLGYPSRQSKELMMRLRLGHALASNCLYLLYEPIKSYQAKVANVPPYFALFGLLEERLLTLSPALCFSNICLRPRGTGLVPDPLQLGHSFEVQSGSSGQTSGSGAFPLGSAPGEKDRSREVES